MSKKELVAIWAVLAAMVGVIIWMPNAQAQQKPYQSYAITGGCLYITPQGFAVIREFNAEKDQVIKEGACN